MTFVSTTITGSAPPLRLGAAQARVREGRDAKLAAQGIGARQKGLGVGRRSRHDLFKGHEDLAIQAAAMLQRAFLEAQVE